MEKNDDPGLDETLRDQAATARSDQLNSTWMGLTCRPHDSTRPRIKAGS